MKDLKVEYINIKDIKPYEKNAKLHPKEQIEQIKRSIQDYGMNDPIAICGDDNTIVEGHGRWLALKELGEETIPVIRLDHLSKTKMQEYLLVHNKLTMNTGFDIDILNAELDAIGLDDPLADMSFYDFEIPNIEERKDVEDVEIPEPPKEAISKFGDLYQLGAHRLLVGDSTNASDVQKLLGGELMDLVVTDPPYNVGIQNSQGMTIENDDMEDGAFKDFLMLAFKNLHDALKQGGAFYVWYASKEHLNFESSLRENNLPVRQQLFWEKNALVLGRSDYQWMHEPCLYGWKEGASHYFIDDRTKTTVLKYNKPSKNEFHPTMKPLGLFGELIQNSSKIGDKVCDLFGGSGTTLICCEQLNRRCYMMEYDPIYADVIIARWENMTGQKAVKMDL